MDYHHHARLTVHSREQMAKRALQEDVSLNFLYIVTHRVEIQTDPLLAVIALVPPAALNEDS